MPLQIANFNIELNLTGIPANRAFNPSGPNSSLLLGTNTNRFINKIQIDAVYNQNGDIIINYYAINFRLINIDNNVIPDQTPILTSGFTNILGENFQINKNKPCVNINQFSAGINLNLIGLRNTLILNNSISPITSTVNFLVTFFYL